MLFYEVVYVNETQFKLNIQRIKEPKYTIFRPTGFFKDANTHTHVKKCTASKPLLLQPQPLETCMYTTQLLL